MPYRRIAPIFAAIHGAVVGFGYLGVHRLDLPETADNNMSAKAIAAALKKEAKVDIVFTVN